MGYGKVAPAPFRFCALAPMVASANTPTAMAFNFTCPPSISMHRSNTSVNTSHFECEGQLLRRGYIGVKTALFHYVLTLGKCENKVASGVKLAFCANRSAVSLHHVPCNCEP